MLEILQKSWNKYKTLKLWQQIALCFPLILLAILCVCLFFLTFGKSRKNNLGTTDEQIAKHKEHIEKEIERNITKEKKLKKQEENIKKNQKKFKKEIEENFNQSKNTIKEINSAIKNNNFKELEKIRKNLNNN